MESRFSANIDQNELSDVENYPEFIKGGPDLSVRQNIRRKPAPSNMDPSKQDFEFMQIDVDYYTGVPPGKIITK